MGSDRDLDEGTPKKKKKVVRKKRVAKKTTMLDVKKMSTADLYSLYIFVANDANNRGFGLTSPEARAVVRERQKEIEEELYLRAYGYNPFEKFKITIEGTKPEDINLDRFAIVKSGESQKSQEPPEHGTKTFVVKKNKE